MAMEAAMPPSCLMRDGAKRAESRWALGERLGRNRQRSVRFDDTSLAGFGAFEADEWNEDDGAASSVTDPSASKHDLEGYDSDSSVVMEESIFKTPAEDPDLIQWQFTIALDKRDAVFLDRVLRLEREKVSAGESEFEIPPMDKAKHLALAMLSGDDEIYKVLAQHVSIQMADDWFSNSHPASRCNCDNNHLGSLLVRLVRAGQREMVTRALKGGIDPNSAICDGDMERMYWNSDGKRDGAKLEAVFQKSTALTASAAVGDIRTMELLLDYGANPEAHDFAVFAVAARYGQINYLQALLANDMFDDFSKMDRGCVVALKAASMENQNKTIDWLLLRLQQFDDWEVRSQPRKKSIGSTMSRTIGGRSRSMGWGSLKAKSRPSTTGSAKRSQSATGSLMGPRNLSGPPSTRRPSSKQLVGEALSNALDELIKDGRRPGSVLRDSLTKGIENVVGLQRKHLPAFEFDASKLLAFYVSATSDSDVYTPEEVAKRLLDLGLGEYLRGDTSTPSVAPPARIEAPPTSDKEDDSPEAHALRRSVRPFAAELGALPPSKGVTMEVTRQRVRAFTVLTTRMMRSMFGSLQNAGPLPQSIASRLSLHRSAKGASDKERRSVVLSAAQVGHMAVLKELLPLCSNDVLESLLEQAARHHQAETVVFLLDEIADRRQRESAKRGGAAAHAAVGEGVDNYVLAKGLMAALAVGDLEMAGFFLEKEATLSTTQITQVLEEIMGNPDKHSSKSIPKVLDLALETDFGARQLAHVLDVALQATTVNLRAVKLLVSRARVHFVNLQHMLKMVDRSCSCSSEESWRTIAELMVKNLLRSPDPAQANKDLTALLFEAETKPHVHVGVLTLLMHSCEIDDPDTDGEESSGDLPSRWL